jgi:hypothetical protein
VGGFGPSSNVKAKNLFFVFILKKVFLEENTEKIKNKTFEQLEES